MKFYPLTVRFHGSGAQPTLHDPLGKLVVSVKNYTTDQEARKLALLLRWAPELYDCLVEYQKGVGDPARVTRIFEAIESLKEDL